MSPGQLLAGSIHPLGWLFAGWPWQPWQWSLWRWFISVPHLPR